MRFLLILTCFVVSAFGQENFRENIHFIVYKDNVPINTSDLPTRDPVQEGLCSADEPLAVITHGWTWSCAQDWVVDLVSKLTVHRGGCIICMDYSYYAENPNYLVLLTQFEDIRQVLHDQMIEYGVAGLLLSTAYMFGFSFGAHLVLQAAGLIGYQVIEQIDICDPAGPGFPIIPDAKDSAKNVQCLHTSIDKGTFYRNCHQDWLMGHCGVLQDSADPNDPPIIGNNHATCPYFYNSAFTNDFPAIPKPLLCLPTLNGAEYPEGFKMGYMETRKEQVQGILYAKTTEDYPYN